MSGPGTVFHFWVVWEHFGTKTLSCVCVCVFIYLIFCSSFFKKKEKGK